VLVAAAVPGGAGGDLVVHEQGGVAEAEGVGQLVPEDGERVPGGGVGPGEVGVDDGEAVAVAAAGGASRGVAEARPIAVLARQPGQHSAGQVLYVDLPVRYS
jgi:hypothetical protein